MRGAVLHAPGDVRVEDRDDPTIVEPTDAVIRLSATCVCGSDLWPYRGADEITDPAPMGHEYCGIVEEVGAEVAGIKPGQFVVGSFFASDNTCEVCRSGYQSSCLHREAAAPGPPRTSGELPYRWDQLRYEFGQGPGLEAIATTGVAPPQDLSREVRWPRLTGRSCPLHRRTSVVTWR